MRKSPFMVSYDPDLKKKCLSWVGDDEKCELCKRYYPMIFISFTGGKFICKGCENRNKRVAELSDYLEECDLCHYDFALADLIIEGDQFLCPKCYKG